MPRTPPLVTDLIDRAASGDPDAFLKLLGYLRPDLAGRLERKLTPSLHNAIDQALHDGFRMVMRKQGFTVPSSSSFPPDQPPRRRPGKAMEVKPFVWPPEATGALKAFRVYAWRFVWQAMRPHIRWQARQKDIQEGLAAVPAGSSQDPAHQAESEERHRLIEKRRQLIPATLQRAMTALRNQNHAEAVRLRFLEGLSIPEVAERLQVSHNLASQWCRRGLEQLREQLRGQTALFFST